MSAISNWLFAKPDDALKEHLVKGQGILGSLESENDIPAEGRHQTWMANIPGSRYLSQLSVPGTHDSAAYNYQGEGKEFWNCQNIPLFSQLNAGIRALDLRYALKDGKLRFFHAIALLDEEAEVVDIIWGLHAWLKKHPTETIFVSLKVDNGDPHAADVQAAMDVVLKDTKDLWVSDLTTKTRLEDAKGKLVLVRRFPFTQPLGYNVSEGWEVNKAHFNIPLNKEKTSRAWIEDFYLLIGCPGDAKQQIGIKYDYTVAQLTRAQAALEKDHKDLWITFSSAVGDRRTAPELEDVTPRVMALGRGETSGINQRLVEWCETGSNGSGKDNRPVGIVFMDFVNIKRQAHGNGEVSDFDLIRCFIEKQQVDV